jgi:hypothetical protein
MRSELPDIYSFYGCRLQSEIPLSHVLPADGDGAPEIKLVLGTVPETLPNPAWSSPFVTISPTEPFWSG